MLNLHKSLLLLAMAAAAFGISPSSATAQSGEIEWTFDLSNISGAFVTVATDGTIYTVDKERLWAIDPTGTVKWSFEDAGGAGGLITAGGGQPVELLADGRIVVAAGHTVWALETDGSVSWSFSWSGGFNNQIDNGPGVGPDGNIYATTAVNDGKGMGVFSLTPDGQLRWQDEPTPALIILNASHNQRVRFTDTRMVFGFMATTGGPMVYAYDFSGNHTNLIDYTCTSSPNTSSDRLLMAGVCGVESIDLQTDTVEWTVDLGAVNMLPIIGGDGVVYSGNWHGPVTAISPQGQPLWTSANVGLQRTLAASGQNGMFLYGGETFGQPNWLGAIDNATGASLWQVPFETVGTHNELIWSNEAAFSPDGDVAYFTTRFTSNGAPGRLWAVRIGDGGAAWSNYGSGWAGGQGVPGFTSRTDPVIGSAITLDLENSLGAATAGLLLIGDQRASIPTNLGGTILVDSLIRTWLSIPANGLALSGSLPDDPSLIGFRLFLQALELDPGASQGASFTPGLELLLGDH